MTCHAGQRTRAVWLQAPARTADAWVHPSGPARLPVSCRFAALPLSLSEETTTQLERLARVR
jgi:hypothetical protein